MPGGTCPDEETPRRRNQAARGMACPYCRAYGNRCHAAARTPRTGRGLMVLVQTIALEVVPVPGAVGSRPPRPSEGGTDGILPEAGLRRDRGRRRMA